MIYTLTNPIFSALTVGTSQLEQWCVGKTGQALEFATGALSADKEVVIAAATKHTDTVAGLDASIEIYQDPFIKRVRFKVYNNRTTLVKITQDGEHVGLPMPCRLVDDAIVAQNILLPLHWHVD